MYLIYYLECYYRGCLLFPLCEEACDRESGRRETPGEGEDECLEECRCFRSQVTRRDGPSEVKLSLVTFTAGPRFFFFHGHGQKETE